MKTTPQIQQAFHGGMSVAGHREFRRQHCNIPMSGVKVLGVVRGPNRVWLVKIETSPSVSLWIEISRVNLSDWMFK